MTFKTGSGTARFVLLAAACVLLALVASCSGPAGSGATTQPAAAEVGAGASTVPEGRASHKTVPVPEGREGWKTIENRGVHVDVPADWERTDMSGCEFDFAQWAPGPSSCRLTTGLAFYGAATFDPFRGPEIQQTAGAAWSGYVYAGSFAVYVMGTDRNLVQEVLDSVRPRASKGP
ncbi:hypothetical protein AB0G04_22435 [Actinoplanes sp. NPDC023801]|uniref:hypothetical protein n=1 Tax=Actinoplanes sp. NPDC023801 TaxID=3154595 RepID=UPI0033DCCCE0